jgi:hypothetical protein
LTQRSNVPTTLSYDEAEAIALGGGLATQEVSRHRWYTKRLVVFSHGAELFGFFYLDPATEMQEDGDVFEADPVPVFSVVAREVTTTIYEAA